MKIFAALTVYVLLGLVLLPRQCIGSASEGIKLCIEVIIPSLLPFFICSKILLKSGFAESISKPFSFLMRPLFNVPACGAFAFVIGILSGCPVGAKTVTDMYEKSACTKAEAQRMLCFCNNSGPVFIMGAVATGMLGYARVGTMLYISHIVSAVVVGMAVSFYRRKEVLDKNVLSAHTSPSNLLGDSVTESVSLTGYVCGFVIFFAVVVEIIKQSGAAMLVAQYFKNKSLVLGMLYGMCEMTNGISVLSSLAITPSLLCAISFVLGFGGVSVMLQVYGIVKKYNFSFCIFVGAKLLQGIISAVLTAIMVGFAKTDLPVFAVKTDYGILNSLAFSINIFAIFGILLLVLSILYIACKILRKV
ncbi:MAG: hypothetical protein IKV86_00050 [Clostridia bacterium]|nr:hypothetical protein [Clostridia bacterium]